MTLALVAGLCFGAGLWVAWTGARPGPEPLGAALARVARPPVAARTLPPDEDRDARVGGFLLGHVPGLSQRVEAARSDLRVVDRTPEEQAIRVGASVVGPLLLGPWLSFVAWLVGIAVPPVVLGGLSLGAAALGLVLPFRNLRRDAAERRTAFSHALSSWCDVVGMTLAAGRGVEQAMETASRAGQGWAFAELRAAIHAGYVRGDTPWVALERLGVELGATDLTELANTIALAGEEGAAVRATVAAKARTIRERMSADSEVAAADLTERMSLPSVLLVFGFLLFICFPAFVAMTNLTG